MLSLPLGSFQSSGQTHMKLVNYLEEHAQIQNKKIKPNGLFNINVSHYFSLKQDSYRWV